MHFLQAWKEKLLVAYKKIRIVFDYDSKLNGKRLPLIWKVAIVNDKTEMQDPYLGHHIW